MKEGYLYKYIIMYLATLTKLNFELLLYAFLYNIQLPQGIGGEDSCGPDVLFRIQFESLWRSKLPFQPS